MDEHRVDPEPIDSSLQPLDDAELERISGGADDWETPLCAVWQDDWLAPI